MSVIMTMKNRGLLNLDEILKNNLSEEAGNESDTVNCEAPDETEVIKHYTNILLKYNPSLEDNIHSSNILNLYYQEIFGEKRHYVDKQLKEWQKLYPTSLILEALSRSVKATTPLSYASTVLEN